MENDWEKTLKQNKQPMGYEAQLAAQPYKHF